MEKKYDIGVIGLAVMGQNLVLNIESREYSVAVYNRTTSKAEGFVKERAEGKDIEAAYSLEDFVAGLKRPRKVLLMVKAGAPVDKVIEGILPLLEKGDIIIDAGNSHFADTNRRLKELNDKGLLYLGTGVSGGEYGALHGPSIMPGGNKEAYPEVKDIFEAIAAQADDGPCVTYLGPTSSGHYVKMIHNGIEYAVMEMIGEVYDIMRKALGLKPEKMSKIFEKWNEEHLSYLMEITYKILAWEDEETGKPIVDLILDRARQKGTGKWSVQDALELGVPIPSITAAVNSRYLSSMKEEREEIGGIFTDQPAGKLDEDIIPSLREALYLGIVIAYAEGMRLLQTASDEYGYELDLAEVARIWEDGCIIRSALLKPIQQAYKDNPDLTNMLIADQFKGRLTDNIGDLRKVTATAKELGIPAPALSAALDYFDSLRSVELPANLTQGQRDYFGAHTYERRDKEGIFHTEWQDIHNIT